MGHRIPFYVAAPYSSFDLKLRDGSRMPMEEREADAVRRPRGALFAPADVPVWSPGFDVTPSELITAIVTDRGVIRAPNAAKIKSMMA